MPQPKNVLWIMCDQLRYGYLGCTGHPTLTTPNIDAMAKRGVRFSKTYVQSPICGPSRMSFYTGRYMRSHGSHWNGWPLRVGEPTLGDHLKNIGVRNVLVGKTHMAPDLEGMKSLGIAPDSIIGCMWPNAASSRMSAMMACTPAEDHARGMTRIFANAAMNRQTRGSIGRTPVRTRTAHCRTAGFSPTPTRRRGCRTNIPRHPT